MNDNDRPVIVRAEQTSFGCPALWDAWDEEGNPWELYFRYGEGTAIRHAAEDARWPGRVFRVDDDMAGVISLEEFCERAGLELRLT